MGYGAPLTGFSANTAAAETTLLPPYNSVAIDSFPKAVGAMPASASASTGVVMKSDSAISYNLPIPRKRGRDHSTINRFLSYPSSHTHSQKNCGRNLYFLGEDISILVQQQQLDLERLISQHMEKVRMEMEEKRKREAIRIMEAIEVGMMGILRSKEEEIEKMGKLNWELEERVNSLCMENQIWRDVAETNEATANALRSDLELVLLDVKKEEEVEEEEKAESCCGSNGGDMEEEEEEEEEEVEEERRKGRKTRRKEEDRRCKNCWKEESCVLLLPCRHLCLCTVCGSSLHHCPICNATNNASVRVIMP